MKLSMMTLGCPSWDLDTICTQGQACGFAGVDFRGYQETLDITLNPLFQQHPGRVRRQLADAGLAVSGISSGITLCNREAQHRNLEEARRTIALARELDTAKVRVFGNHDPATKVRADWIQYGSEMMHAIAALDGARDLQWLVETHDDWVRSDDYLSLFVRLPADAVGTLWDVCLTNAYGGEAVDDTFARLAAHVANVHLKDAVAVAQPDGKTGWRYVTPGTGAVPLARAIQLLRARGYDGWLVCEHEKRWHPELPDPEQYFPQFVQWITPLLA